MKPFAGPIPEAQGSKDRAQLGPVAGLGTVVAERSLPFEPTLDNEAAPRTVSLTAMPECPAGPWLGSPIVQAGPISANKAYAEVVGQSVSASDMTLGQVEKPMLRRACLAYLNNFMLRLWPQKS
jgi:hypothetical protein